MPTKKIETSARYANPHRPLPIALFNKAGKLFDGTFLPADLKVEKLLGAARKKTGLTDFGDEWFLEPLAMLVKSINEEAQLTTLGKIVQRGRLIAALSHRLRTEALCKAHPEILQQDLGKIIVIAGLQRTGTTTLHRLLAADPDIRALSSWEALNPTPLDKEEPGKPKKRIAQAKAAERGLAYLAPEFFAIHPVEYDAPEEDVLLLDISFMSQAPEATLNVPGYAAWLETQDHTPAYRYLHKLLKVLQWQRPAKNWVLKTPHHMEYLDTLLKVFPQARIIQTHRDPQKTTGSFCSMVAHGRGIFSDAVDPVAVANHWLRKVHRMMELSIAVREKQGDEQFIDISYYDLLNNPLAEIKKIYDFAGLEFNDTVANAITQTTRKNVQHRYGKHHYDLADFGLSKERIENEFGFYRKKYAIPHED